MKKIFSKQHAHTLTALLLALALLLGTPLSARATGWNYIGSPRFSGRIDNISLALDSSNTPYVAFRDVNNAYKATVMKYNGTTSSWEIVGAAGFSAGNAYGISLALDSSNTPYVAYSDTANSYKATVMKYNGSSWEAVGAAGFSAGEADYPSLALDSGGTPYVAFRRRQ